MGKYKKISYKNKPEYSKGDTVIYNGNETKIIEVSDSRDYSDMFRPDYKDGLEYTIIDENGEESCGFHWWDFEI
jgi:hypothetical protein